MLPLADNIPHRRPPYITYAIIVACVAVFFYQQYRPEVLYQQAFRPYYVLPVRVPAAAVTGAHLPPPPDMPHDPAAPVPKPTFALAQWYALVSMFMHGGLFHLLFNMWFLWIFGDNVEDRMGRWRFLIFYLVCGYAATLAHVLSAGVELSFSGGLSTLIPIIGASGAIAGVLGAYCKLFPHATIRTLVPVFIVYTLVNLPAVVFIVIWFALQLFMGLSSLGTSSGVAFWAHVGGFLAGLLLVRFFTPSRLPRRPPRPRVVDIRW